MRDTLSVGEASERFGLHPATIRRLCEDGRVPAEKIAGHWELAVQSLEEYLRRRRSAGRGPARVRVEGPAPNPGHRDADGWRLAILRGDKWIPADVWLNGSLVALLAARKYKPFDLVLKGAERLVEDELIRSDGALESLEIVLGPGDFSRLIRAAGLWTGEYLAGEGPAESGVVSSYEFSPNETSGRSLNVGQMLLRGGGPSTVPEGFVEVVVDWSMVNGRRRIRTVRLPAPPPSTATAALLAAVAAYRDRCARTGLVPATWVAHLQDRLSPAPPQIDNGPPESLSGSVGQLRNAIAGMPDGPAPPFLPFFAQWSTSGRHHLNQWIDDLSATASSAAASIEAAASSARPGDGADALEYALWRIDSAADKLMVVIALALGVQVLRVSKAGSGVVFRPSPKLVLARLAELRAGSPAATRLNALLQELHQHPARDLRNEVSHALSPVGDLRPLCHFAIVYLTAGHRQLSQARMLYGGAALWDAEDMTADAVWHRTLAMTRDAFDLLVRAMVATADLVTDAGSLAPPPTVFHNLDQGKTLLADPGPTYGQLGP